MKLYEAISRRKSCRSYTGDAFDQQKLSEIEGIIADLTPLYPEITLDWRLAEGMKGPFKVDAPHYLIISGQGKEGETESAGFIFQQLMLWFNNQGIGSVWLGGPRDIQKNLSGKDIVAIAFGQPKGSVHRKPSEFRRKPIADITNDPNDPCIQAVHLAPSGINLQPWYLEKINNRVLLHRQVLKPPFSLFYKLTEVDLGIALCHYALACQHYGKPFVFERLDEQGQIKGFNLFGKLG